MSTSDRASAGLYDQLSPRLAAGGRLTPDEIGGLASTHDILALGMLADEARRQARGTRVTFARVACCAFDKPLAEAVPPAAREVRLIGAPPSTAVALTAVRSAKAVAGDRLLSGFSLADLQTLAGAGTASLVALLQRLRDAGLESIAEIPVDRLPSPDASLQALAAAGFERVRLTVSRPGAAERVAIAFRTAELAERHPIVHAIGPLPMALAAFQPTTGYEDVRVVALTRLAAPSRTLIQIDWQRYGPKLAQVALTFGADDLDNVSPSDDAPDGRRRAPVEDVRRNIESAGFTAVARDGRWQ